MFGFSAILLMTAASAQPAAVPGGVELASAQVSAQILRPAIVRQGSGWERAAPDAPEPRIARRGGMVLVEFQ